MTRTRSLVAATLVSVLTIGAGCASTPTLTLTPDTKLADGGPGATATAEDVRVVATLDEWRYDPEELGDFVTPVHVNIHNDSDHPIRVRFSDIRMMGDNGVRLAALPPYRVEGKVRRTVPSDRYEFDNFAVAPYLRGYYVEAMPSDDLFYHDFYYYNSYYPLFERYSIELPTKPMVRRALPEGTLEPGGEVSGFVYFERVDRRVAKRTRRLDLLFRVYDPDAHREVGLVEIPFEIRP